MAGLAAHAMNFNSPGELVLIDRSENRWRGRAYQLDGDYILTNLPFGVMSIQPDDPEHGLRWARSRGLDVDPDLDGTQKFVPRAEFGRYLEQSVAEALAALEHAGWRVLRVDELAAELNMTGDGVEVRTDTGRRIIVDHLVLCVSDALYQDSYGLQGAQGYFIDPYPVAELVAGIPNCSDVGVIGSGLAAVDVVAGLHARGHRGRIDLFSRNGLLPAVRRRSTPVQPRTLTRATAIKSKLLSLTELVALAAEEVRAAGGDFDRFAEDFLRPEAAPQRLRRQLAELGTGDVTAALLQRALLDAAQDFWCALAEDSKDWLIANAYPHLMSWSSPMPRNNAELLAELIDRGQLNVWAGTAGVAVRDHGFTVQTAYGEVPVEFLVNTVTPARRGFPRKAHGLIDCAVRVGILRPHPRGGVDIDTATGYAIGGDGQVRHTVSVLGELTSGAYFFVTTVPLFVRRANHVAAAIAARSPSSH